MLHRNHLKILCLVEKKLDKIKQLCVELIRIENWKCWKILRNLKESFIASVLLHQAKKSIKNWYLSYIKKMVCWNFFLFILWNAVVCCEIHSTCWIVFFSYAAFKIVFEVYESVKMVFWFLSNVICFDIRDTILFLEWITSIFDFVLWKKW